MRNALNVRQLNVCVVTILPHFLLTVACAKFTLNVMACQLDAKLLDLSKINLRRFVVMLKVALKRFSMGTFYSIFFFF